MADVARLGLSVDSAPVEKGTRALDSLTNAAAKAERAGGGLQNAFARLEKALASIEAAVRDVEGAVRAMGTVSDRAGGSISSLSGYSVKLSGSLKVVDGNAAAAGSALQRMATEAAQASTAQTSAASAADNLAGRALAVSKATEAEVRNLLQVAAASQLATSAMDAEARSLITRLGASQRAARGTRENADAIEEEIRALLQLAAANRKLPAANDNRLRGHELQNLGFQLNDALTMLASGSSPLQVVATQGGQVLQVLQGAQGGVSGALKDIGSRLLGLITPARLAFGGMIALVATLVLSFANVTSETKEMQRALMGTGAATQATASGLMSIADQAKKSAGISGDSARDMVTAFTRTGKISTQFYVDASNAAAGYAYVTGEELPAATAAIAKALADPARGVADLDDKLNFLDQTTLDYVRTLALTGQRQQAQQVLLEKLNEQLPTAAQRVSALARAWQLVTQPADDALTAMGRVVDRVLNGGTLEQQLDAARKAAKIYQDAVAKNPNGMTLAADGMTPITNQAALDASIRKIEELTGKVQAAGAAAEKASTDAAVKAGTSVVESMDPRIEQLRGLVKQQAALREALDKASASGGNTDFFLAGLNNIGDQIAAISKNGKDLIPVLDQMQERAALLAKVNGATTTTQRISAQRDLELFDEKAKGTATAVANAQAENNAYQAQVQLSAQLLLAQRERMTAAREAVTTAHAEAAAIGLTAGQIAEANANRQAELTLRREAQQNGTAFDYAELSRLKAKNAELRTEVDLRQQAQLSSDMGFEWRQLGRSDIEQQVASTLRGYGMEENLNSANAGVVRMTLALKEFRDTSTSAFQGFADDLINGTKWTDALGNSLKRLASQFANKAISSLGSSLFGSLSGSLFGGGTGFNDSVWGFAQGGVMTPQGPRRLQKFANGGVSNAAAIFGEAGPEAAVPLPDGRRIPVDLRMPAAAAGGGNFTFAPSTNITVGAGAGPDDVAAALDARDRQLRKEFEARMPGLAIKAVAQAKTNNIAGIR